MLRFPRSLTFLLLFFISLFNCDPAQSKNVPVDFSRENFDEIIHYALNHYIDPNRVNISRSYIGAAEAALASLPSPVFIMPRSFYEQREKFQSSRRMVPGKMVEISGDLPYVLLVPDYQKWEKKREKLDKEERERFQKMSEARKREEAERLRKQLQDEKKALERAWDRVDFTPRDFEHVISWLDSNMDQFSSPPPGQKEKRGEEETPFGMHVVYFNATNGFLQTMDPHSGIIDAKAWDKIRKESEDSSFEGIGALLRGGGTQDVIVETPLANSPALRAGLRAGDIIRKVDGTSIESRSLSEVVKMIRGPRETIVVLSVERSALKTIHDISIKRGVIEQRAVSSEYLPDQKVGVIKISSFLYKGSETSYMVKEEFRSILNQSGGSLRGLVIDLRNNPGGFLEEAINVAGLFLDAGKVVVQTRGRHTGLMPRQNHYEPEIKNIPVIVLVNAASASASEIVASALKDHNRALILGERSFGKASVQEMKTQGDIIVKLTTARYYAPRGYTIQVYGVNPDIPVSDEEDGSFPEKFREEDMWKHLPELEQREPDSGREEWIRKLKKVVGDNRAAEQYLKKHKNDARRPDYMLIRALSYFDALYRYPRP